MCKAAADARASSLTLHLAQEVGSQQGATHKIHHDEEPIFLAISPRKNLNLPSGSVASVDSLYCIVLPIIQTQIWSNVHPRSH